MHQFLTKIDQTFENLSIFRHKSPHLCYIHRNIICICYMSTCIKAKSHYIYYSVCIYIIFLCLGNDTLLVRISFCIFFFRNEQNDTRIFQIVFVFNHDTT